MSDQARIMKRMLLRHWQNVGRGFDTVDHVLRGRETACSRTGLPLTTVATLVVVCGLVYGLVMGSYAAIAGERDWTAQGWQMAYSAVKVPLLIALTLLISLPSFWVLSTLLGLRDDFRQSLSAIVSAQAGLMIILSSLAPLTLLCYVSLSGPAAYSMAVLINAFFFGFSSVTAQRLLARYYRQLIQRNSRHRVMLRVWILVYAFVGIQSGYVLRPFIGSPARPITFFREEPFENAYVRVLGMVWEVLTGG